MDKQKITRFKAQSKKLDLVFNQLSSTLNMSQLCLFQKYLELKADVRAYELMEFIEGLK
jgi:hypothetical protein